MEQLYNTVMARLKTVTEIKEIDFDMGQLESLNSDERPTVLFPCALIDIAYPACEDEDEDATTQMVTAQVSIRLAFQVQQSTDSLTPDTQRNAALAYFSIVRKAFNSLQGYSTPVYATFTRKRQEPVPTGPGIKIIDLIFETSFEESVDD